MSDRSVSGDQPEPKKMGLNLSLFLGPTADAQTSIGKIYLYPMRVSDFSRFEKIVADEPMARFREVLPCVASLSTTSKIEKDREPLAPELVAQLSNADVELVAEAYAASSALQTARSGSEDIPHFDHVTALPCGMLDSAFRTRLIALPCLFCGLAPGKFFAVVHTVAIAMLTVATNKNPLSRSKRNENLVLERFIAVFCVLTACICVCELGLLFPRPLLLRLDQQPT